MRLVSVLMVVIAVVSWRWPAARAAGRDRVVWATISTQNGTSPPFPCDVSVASLVYAPVALPAGATRLISSVGQCWLTGATAVGEYVVRPANTTGLVVVKAINLTQPVTNLGGAVVFAESWRDPHVIDGDSHSDMWAQEGSGCHRGGGRGGAPAAAGGRLQLGPACGVTTVPHEARTFNFFRHPLSLTVHDVRLFGRSSVRIALAVPSAAAVNRTAWPSVKHYLQPLQTPGQVTAAAAVSDAGSPASLAVTLSSGGEVKLLRRRTTGGQADTIGATRLATSCRSGWTVKLFAGATFVTSTAQKSGGSVAPPLKTNVQVFCGAAAASPAAAHIADVDLGLGFLDDHGFGEGVGEAVLQITALPTVESGRSALARVSVGHIQISNDLDRTFSPAVLAPISDRVGTVNWDHGTLGSGRFGTDDGILDVTLPPFLADNSGNRDATVALQSAIDFARHNYLTLWLPVGEYRVTQSLRALQHPRQSANGFAGLNLTANFCFNRYTSWAIRGEVQLSDSDPVTLAQSGRAGRPGRATLVLPAHTPAFSLITGDKTPPLAVLNVSSVNSHFQLEPNILMNTIVQSIDVIIGAGNPAAVGVRMRGAQGSGLEDIGVFAATDAFAGVSGVSGSGGAHINITVVGARFGIDARDTQPSSSLANVRLVRQSCAALIHEGLETLTIAGLFVAVDDDAEPCTASIITGSPYGGDGEPTQLPGLPRTGKCSMLLSPATNIGQNKYIMGTLSIVDAGFECIGRNCANQTAVVGNRNMYMRRGTVVGFGKIVTAHDAGNGSVLYTLPASCTATTVNEVSIHMPTRPGTINGTAYLNGAAIADSTAPIVNVSSLSPASRAAHSFDRACDRYGWGDNLRFPSHASPGALNVRDFGASGDGRHDDSASIQRCIQAAAAAGLPVFVPRGVFRTKTTLVVPRGVQIVGLARHLTAIVSDDQVFGGSPLENSRQFDKNSVVGDAPPLLLYSNKPATKMPMSPVETVVFGISLIVPTFNVRANASMMVFRSSARSGGFNIWRQMWAARLNVCGQYWGDQCRDRFFAQLPYNNAYTRIEGENTTLRMFVYYQEDSQNSVGLASQSAFYRKLLIEGTRKQIDIVQLNGEHSHTTAYSEFVNTSGVSVLGCKSERDGPVIFLRSSRHFASYGHGGAAHEIAAQIPAKQCNGQSPCPWSPSLYRVLDSADVRFVNLQMQFYAASNSMMYEEHDGVVSLAPKGEWPSLWFRTPE
jgi:hypothetical protein